MPWKTGSNEDHVWVDETTGEERVVDAAKLFGTVTRLNSESAERRKRAEALEAQLKEALGKLEAFKGDDGELMDVATAKQAIDAVKNFDGNKKALAEENAKAIARAVTENTETWKAKYATLEAEKAKILAQVEDLTVGHAFDAIESSFIREKTMFPTAQTARAEFGKFFRPKLDAPHGVEAVDAGGNPIFNGNGEPASPAEALEILLSKHPRKADYLRAPNPAGPGVIPGAVPKGAIKPDLSSLPPVDRLASAFSAPTPPH